MTFTDIPDRCKVRQTIDYDEEGNAVGEHWEKAAYCYVGVAKMHDGTKRKFYVAADDMTDAMWELPDPDAPGPVRAVVAQISRDDVKGVAIAAGAVCDDFDEWTDEVRRHAIRVPLSLLKKWYDAGILRNPA